MIPYECHENSYITFENFNFMCIETVLFNENLLKAFTKRPGIMI